MTPLEEIEQAIAQVPNTFREPSGRLGLLGPLYQARAIERLEATVRAIGVILQTELENSNIRRRDGQ